MDRQKARLRRGYERYWYSSDKGEPTKKAGWPCGVEPWRKLQGWVAQRRVSAAAASARVTAQAARMFRDLHPLFEFVSTARWQAPRRGEKSYA